MRETLEEYAANKFDREGLESIPFNKKVTGKSYQIELSMHDFSSLFSYDAQGIHDDEGIISLADTLELFGANEVDFNPMFGAIIMFDMYVEDDTQENWDGIQSSIEKYVFFAHAWQAREDAIIESERNLA